MTEKKVETVSEIPEATAAPGVDEGVIITAPQLAIEGLSNCARFCDVDPNTLRKWIDKGLPFVKQGQGRGDPWIFDAKDVHRWVVNYQIEKVREETPINDEEDAALKEWELRDKRASALTREHKLDQARDIFIRMDDAVAEREEADAAVRTAALELPGRLGQEVALESSAEECVRILRRGVDEMLAKLVVSFTDDIPDELKGDETEDET